MLYTARVGCAFVCLKVCRKVLWVADNGVDGVKVDVQGTVGLMGSKLGGGPSMTNKYHASLESSVQATFPGNHCINCMCHSTENLYRSVSSLTCSVYPAACLSLKTFVSWQGSIRPCSTVPVKECLQFMPVACRLRPCKKRSYTSLIA